MANVQYKPSTDNTNDIVVQAFVEDSVFGMSNKDRIWLSHGATFTLQLGEEIIAEGIPKRSAMAMSTFFNDALTKHPLSSLIQVNPAQLNERPLQILADYITGNSKTNNPFALRIPETLVNLIDLYRHAVVLGMDPHAGGLRAKILEHLANQFSVSFVALNEFAKLPVSDRCYQAAVRKLEGLVHIKAIDKDTEDWKAWTRDHAEFVAAMIEFKATREEAAMENRKRQEDARKIQQAKEWEESFPPLV